MNVLKMKYDLPGWAKKKVEPGQRSAAEMRELYDQGRAQIQLPDLKELKRWAKSRSWPTPWFGFQNAFLTKLFESDETLSSALESSGIKIHVPIPKHTVTQERVADFDELYEGRRFELLVDHLREKRRLVEAGIEVDIEGTDTVLKSWQDFYSWAHGRYPLLEEGADSWIGDDNS